MHLLILGAAVAAIITLAAAAVLLHWSVPSLHKEGDPMPSIPARVHEQQLGIEAILNEITSRQAAQADINIELLKESPDGTR